MREFTLGEIVVTRGIYEKMNCDTLFALEVYKCILKYRKQDWGDTCLEDKIENSNALKNGYRIFAVYNINENTIFIITEADRQYTTIMFNHEY